MSIKCLTETEYHTLKAALARTPGKEQLLIELLLRTGMRCDELCKLRKSDFDFDSLSVFVHGSKGSLNRRVPLEYEFVARLEAGLIRDLKDPKLISSVCETKDPKSQTRAIRRIWKRVARLALSAERIRELGAHVLRHTYGTKVQRATNDPFKTQIAMGHKSMSSTARYMHHILEESLRSDILRAMQ